jgi:hypothetical protein
MIFDLSKMTWRCHVCGDERPDEKISVYKREHHSPVRMTENIRYCNDRQPCIDGAPNHSHFTPKDDA